MEQCDVLSKYNKKLLANFYKALWLYLWNSLGRRGKEKLLKKRKQSMWNKREISCVLLKLPICISSVFGYCYFSRAKNTDRNKPKAPDSPKTIFDTFFFAVYLHYCFFYLHWLNWLIQLVLSDLLVTENFMGWSRARLELF